MTTQQLFDRILRRMASAPPQTVNFMDAVNDVLEIVGTILLDFKSNMIRQEKVVSIVAGKSNYALPSNFWGMFAPPYINDSTNGPSELVISNGPVDFENNESTKPLAYEIIHVNGSDSIRLFPVPDQAYTLKLAYNIKPVIEDMADELPFNGLFDSAIADILVRVGNSGGWSTISQDWPAIEQKVNLILRTRTPRTLRPINVKALWA